MARWRPVLFVFLPFAAGFYLSYLFRSINALIASNLKSDLALDAAGLGFLTSMFFLTFAALQLPLGGWLDRHGPRRVQAMLLIVAALGAALFALAQSFPELVVARALIGLGMAAAMMAGMKAIVLWFPKERLALVNCCFVMLGGLGAVTATAPAEWLVASIGWRGLFACLSALSACCAGLIYLVVPESKPVSAGATLQDSTLRLTAIYIDPRFWRVAPLSVTCAATVWAFQGLWAAAWLADVEEFSQEAIVQCLFGMALAFCASALLSGIAADWLGRRGNGPELVLVSIAAVSGAAQLALILRWPFPQTLLWSLIATAGSAPALSFSILARYYSKESVGRANGALNVLHFAAAFALQLAVGLVIHQWLPADGRYPKIAYQTALTLNLGLQAVALTWFGWPAIQKWRAGRISACTAAAPVTRPKLSDPHSRYDQAARVWDEHLRGARIQVRRWRLAAVASMTLCVTLALTVAMTAARSAVVPYIVHTDRTHAIGVARLHHLDAQIAYFLARFIENIRSLPTDPVVVRNNWLNAYEFVTDRTARTLNDYVSVVDPASRVGKAIVAVEVISVQPVSRDSFRVRWREETFENGTSPRVEYFASLITATIQPPKVVEPGNPNPLGLKVDSFNWWRQFAVEQANAIPE
jgi:type IV secretory pathway TrbF-like protein/sugar phosphate permease